MLLVICSSYLQAAEHLKTPTLAAASFLAAIWSRTRQQAAQTPQPKAAPIAAPIHTKLLLQAAATALMCSTSSNMRLGRKALRDTPYPNSHQQ